MRALALVVVAACADSVEERLASFQADTEAVCGHAPERSVFDACDSDEVTGAEVAACMNDALARGVRARASWVSRDMQNYANVTYVFTIYGQVKPFRDYPDGDNFSPPYTAELPTCAGPFDGGSGCFKSLSWECP